MSDELSGLGAAELKRRGQLARRGANASEYRACIRELERRSTKAARAALEELKAQAPQVGSKNGSAPANKPRVPKAWVERAARVSARLKSDMAGARAVYVVLLDRNEGGEYGLYVGATGRTPEERFAQHKDGYKSSRHVREHGICLLPSVGAHLTRMSSECAKRIEGELAERLRDAGFEVEGGH